MNFLFVPTIHSIYDIPWALLEMKHSVDMVDFSGFDPLTPSANGSLLVEEKLTTNHYDYVISYLFLPEISNLCEKYHLCYISWTYDSPLISLFDKSIHNECNRIFLFDKTEFSYFKARNVKHLYYLPMAANLTRTGALDIASEDEKNYSCDISFIGNLYEDNNYNQSIGFFPEELALELKTYLMENLCNWTKPKFWPILSKDVTNFMIQNLHADQWNPYPVDDSLFLGMLVLTRKLAEMDRLTVLNALGEHYKVDLFTNSHSNYLTNVIRHDGVNYETDMNKIFYLSKINLNITLPSIETGLPQRIFDIMGCGGFVLTNYQEEIDDLFEIGKEIEVFHDLPELLEKTTYYLSHEKERLQIAMNGYKAIAAKHTYIHRITEIIHKVQEETD